MASKKTDSEQLAHIADTLERILNLLAHQYAAGESLTDSARALKRVGMDNQSIAQILNTTPATIRTVTSNLKMKR